MTDFPLISNANLSGFIDGGRFFYGANSENGFIAFGNEIVNDNFDLVINIIGGPGTGKSRLMTAIADFAENNGIGCERYFCSSDPSSLDAIRLFDYNSGRKAFVCDATAPHSREYSTPGAVCRVADLSSFWDTEKLRKSRDTIVNLQNKKKEHYEKAYRHLSICGRILNNQCFSKEFFEMDKIQDKINGLIKRSSPDGENVIDRPVSSISMFGEKILQNGYKSPCNAIKIKDIWGFGKVFTEMLIEECVRRKLTVYRAPCPICTDLTEELYIPSASLLLTSSKNLNIKSLQTKRYVKADHIQEYETIGKEIIASSAKFKSFALSELSKAKEYHFKLEELYGAAMNFEAKNKFDKEIVKVVSLIFLK